MSHLTTVVTALPPGAWILTGGLREGVARCVGEAVRDHGAAAPALSQKKVIAIGLATWGLVHNRQQLVNSQVIIIMQYAYHELVMRFSPTLQVLSLCLKLSHRHFTREMYYLSPDYFNML